MRIVGEKKSTVSHVSEGYTSYKKQVIKDLKCLTVIMHVHNMKYVGCTPPRLGFIKPA